MIRCVASVDSGTVQCCGHSLINQVYEQIKKLPCLPSSSSYGVAAVADDDDNDDQRWCFLIAANTTLVVSLNPCFNITYKQKTATSSNVIAINNNL